MSFTVTKGGVPLTVKLEYSASDLSVGSPVYSDVSPDLIEIEWWAGRSDELGEPSPGGMTVLLRNLTNRWTPGLAAGIDTERRFRLTLTDPVGASQQGVWYTEGFEPVYPASDERSLMKITCVDGFGLLEGDRLAAFDPPEASSYADVIAFDQPSFYYRLGEPEGTKLVSHARKTKRGGETRTRRWKTRETRAEVEGIAGPSGTYKGSPALGASGLIVGDTDTSVLLDGVNDYAAVPVDTENTIEGNRLTVECWQEDTSGNCLVSGPYVTAITEPAWELRFTGNTLQFVCRFTDGTSATASITRANGYAAGVWDGNEVRVYQNGGANLASSSAAGKVLRTPDVDYIRIGARKTSGSVGDFVSGKIDEVAIYEKALSSSRILAHNAAGAERGFAQELTGTRIVNALTSSLWSEAKIQTGKFQMQPRFYVGASKLEAVLEAVGCEAPKAHFYFDGAGDPVFRDFDYDDGLAISGTFGQGDDAGTLPYADVAPIFDNAAWNTIRGSRDGGTLQTVTDSARVTSNGPRVREDEVSLPLASDADVDTILHAILDGWSQATQSFAECMIYAVDAGRISHALRREPGDRIEVVKSPWRREVPILGFRKTLTSDGVLTCRWNLGRGVDALEDTWLLGVPGRSELGTTTVLG